MKNKIISTNKNIIDIYWLTYSNSMISYFIFFFNKLKNKINETI